MCQRLPFTVSNRATTGATGLPHAVPTISSTVPMFSQSQHIRGAFQKVQLAVRVIQPFHLHMTQKVMSACARLSAPETGTRSGSMWCPNPLLLAGEQLGSSPEV